MINILENKNRYCSDNIINLYGSGEFDSICPICGLYFHLWYDNEEYVDNKNFINFENILYSDQSINFDNITILYPEKEISHNNKYIARTTFFNKDKFNQAKNKNKNKFDVLFHKNNTKNLYFNSLKGLPMHYECWNLANKVLKHKLTYEDFYYNKLNNIKNKNSKFYTLDYLDYNPVKKYWGQFFNDSLNIFLLNKKDWYIIYSPFRKSKESKKNYNRILKNLKKIIKNISSPNKSIKKSKSKKRKGPSESATLFKSGTKKIGNDKQMWIIVKNKNGIKKWQKIKQIDGTLNDKYSYKYFKYKKKYLKLKNQI